MILPLLRKERQSASTGVWDKYLVVKEYEFVGLCLGGALWMLTRGWVMVSNGPETLLSRAKNFLTRPARVYQLRKTRRQSDKPYIL
jgi:hypothetical protein